MEQGEELFRSSNMSATSINDIPNSSNNDPKSCFTELLSFLYSDFAVDIKPVPNLKVSSIKKVTQRVSTPTQQNKEELTNIDVTSVKIENSSTSLSLPSSSNSTSVSKRQSRPTIQKKKTTTAAVTSADAVKETKISWEDSMKEKLLFKSLEEYNAFKEDQGFQQPGEQKDIHLDFGTPDLSYERMPRYATSIPNRLCKESTSLSVYKSLQSARADTMSILQSHMEHALSKQKIFDFDSKVKKQRQEQLDAKETVITVDFYHPSPSANVVRKTGSNCFGSPSVATTIEILGSQTLKELQSKFLCENDLVYIKNLVTPENARRLEECNFAMVADETTFQSGAIVINNTAYVNYVIPNYGDVMNKWDSKKSYPIQSESSKTDSLDALLNSIDFQLGQPYLYIHNPNCEHLLIFRNVRYLHAYDPQTANVYPRFTYVGGFSSIPCRVDESHVAHYVVKGCDRLPEYLTPLCRECCENFCYTTNELGYDEPIGSFKLFPLVQVPSLLLNVCKI